MNYSKALDDLYALTLHGGIKLGLKTMQALSEAMAQPEFNYPSVHIAGTNGKGTVATKLAAAFQAAGYCAGLYTSPHISSFCERFQVDGEMISEESCAQLIQELIALAKEHELPATFFEISTAIAFQHFAREKVDVAVIETGLGGRLDATNIIRPKLSIITSIAKDHCAYLGDTLEQITKEKAGIIKEGTPVIIGPSVPKGVIEGIATERQAPLICVEGTFPSAEAENQALAEKALEILDKGFPRLLNQGRKGLSARPPCRRQVFERPGKKPILFDVAHNPAAITRLFAELPGKSYRLVATVSEGREVEEICQALEPHVSHIHWVPASNGRTLSYQELAKLLPEKSSVHPSPKEGLQAAESYDEPIVVCGSFFILDELLPSR